MQTNTNSELPFKSILKTSVSFDKSSKDKYQKCAKFDELNVLKTFHPIDKDYGHMKIDEPKTPFIYNDDYSAEQHEELDTKSLVEKLQMVANIQVSHHFDSDMRVESEAESKRRKEFELRRKAHYREYEAVKLARKLMKEEDDEADDHDCSDEKSAN